MSPRLGLLVGRLRGRAERQQAVRGAIDWSYHLLSAEEQQLFRRLAVFQGGSTLDAITAVCNANNSLALDAQTGVEALVKQSLLQQREGPEGEPRFWLLETIHEYAREKLHTSDEVAALPDRHLAYFGRLVERAEPELTGPQGREWLDRLEKEHDNIRAALGWAACHGSTPARGSRGRRPAGVGAQRRKVRRIG